MSTKYHTRSGSLRMSAGVGRPRRLSRTSFSSKNSNPELVPEHLWDCEIIHAEVPKWQDVQHGDKMRTLYFINLENSNGKKWSVFKTYTMFQDLHERIKSQSMMVQLFKFPNKSKFNTHADFTKERRRSGFEDYARLVTMTLSPIPIEVQQFFSPRTWEVEAYEQVKKTGVLTYDANKAFPGEEITPRDREALLQEAAWGNGRKLAALLLKGCDPGHRNDRGETALHKAAEGGKDGCVALLLEYGGEDCVDAQDAEGRTALYLACYKTQAKVVSLLLEAGADPEIAANDTSKPGDRFDDGLFASEDNKQIVLRMLQSMRSRRETEDNLFADQLREELESKEAVLRRLEDTLAAAKARELEHKKDAAAQRRNADIALTQAKKNLDALSGELRDLEAQYAAKVKEEDARAEELVSLRARIAAREEATASAQGEKGAFAAQLEEAERALEQTRGQLAVRERELDRKDKALGAAHARHEAYKKKAGASGGALSESDKDKVIADLEDDYKQLSQAHDNGKQMVKDLEAELQSTSDRLKALEENYKSLTDKKMDLDSELATARLTLEKREALVEGLHSEKSGLAERLQLLEQHLERSKEQLEEHQQTAEAKHREAEQHLETIRRLERAADDPRSSEKEKELYREWGKAEAALLAQWEEAEAALLGELDRHEKKRQVEVQDATAAAYLVAAVVFLVLALGECAAPGGRGGLAEYLGELYM